MTKRQILLMVLAIFSVICAAISLYFMYSVNSNIKNEYWGGDVVDITVENNNVDKNQAVVVDDLEQSFDQILPDDDIAEMYDGNSDFGFIDIQD